MDILSKIQRKWHRTFCKHEWKFEGAESTRQYWPRNTAFVYVCEKCGSHKVINCYDIEELIRKFGEKDNYDYVEETVLLPNGYGLYNKEYTGRYVGHAVKWYWDHEGVLISAYSNEQDRKLYKMPYYNEEVN